MVLSEREQERYKRQLHIHQWGEEGQQKLKEKSVFIAGAGGLGCPVATSLALAGVGRLVVCDSDHVEVSNLNRQFLHTESDLEIEKSLSAANSLAELNPNTKTIHLTATIDDATVASLVDGCDIIVDCLDNLEGRMALNTYSVHNNLPLVHGGVWGLEGRLTFHNPPTTPCLRCLYHEALPDSIIPVAAVTTFVIGAMQATEVIKYLLGMGNLATGRLILCSLDSMSFHELPTEKDPNCPVCGNRAA